MPVDVPDIFWLNDKIGATSDGGLAVRKTNKTGALSVKGTIVKNSATTDNAFDVANTDAIDPTGVVYEGGVADGNECWVVVNGIAQVLLEDSTAATRDNWVRTSSTTAGRADATGSSPPSQIVHFQEVGHADESQSAGTDVLCRVSVHFN
jgi:hypothetical protein